MNVEFIYNTDFKLNNEKSISSWVSSFCTSQGYNAESIIFAFFNDEELKKLNIRFLSHNYYTDVLSFNESENNKIMGNIAISVDRVRDNAATYSSGFDEELKRVLIHGVLHFMGYKDESDEEISKIRKMEDLALGMFHVKH